MELLMASGAAFDQNQDITQFTAVKQRLQLDSLYIVRVLYEWCKYLGNQFASSYSGDYSITGKVNWASLSLESNFYALYDNLKVNLQANITYANLVASKVSCGTVLSATAPSVTPSQIMAFCPAGYNQGNILTLFGFCFDQSKSNYYQNFLKYFGFSFYQMKLMCDRSNDAQDSLGSFINQMEAQLAGQYNCTGNYCSAYTLSVLQIAQSLVTLNPPAAILLAASPTVATWMPSVFPKGFEVVYFLNFSGNINSLAPLTYPVALQAFTFNNFFGLLPAVRGIVESQSGDPSFIQARFGFNDSQIFEQYINYVTIELYLGGLSFSTTMRQTLLGFKPPIVNKLRTTPPLTGGDPSSPEYIGFNQNLTSFVQTRYTGKSDLSKVGTYYATNNLRTINMLRRFWDGASVTNQTYNPWAQQVGLAGGDSGFTPKSNQNTVLTGYLNELYRSVNSVYDSKLKLDNGLNTLLFKSLDSDFYDSGQNSANAKYYQTKYTGALNLTQVQRAPVFTTNLLFDKFNSSVAARITLLSSAGQPLFPDPSYESLVQVEPRSGTPVKITVNFQINLDMSQDTLLQTSPSLMLPLYCLRRSMQLDDSQVTY